MNSRKHHHSRFVIVAALLAAPTFAATPASYAALDKASEATCLKAAGLKDGAAGPVVRFSDRTRMDARVVNGIWPQPHMQGKAASMLCIYHRRSGHVEVQELSTN